MEGTVYSDYFTVGDVPQKLITYDLKFEDLNMHIEDFDIQYGNAKNVSAIAVSGSTITFRKGNLKDFLVKNRVGASIAHISIVATIKE